MTIALAMLLDAVFGEPRTLYERWPHPAVILGRVISWFDVRFNSGTQKQLKGLAGMFALIVVAFVLSAIVTQLALIGPIVEIMLGAALLAQRSLVQHVKAVALALGYSAGEAQRSVAMIVGRDTNEMTSSDVSRAAIESAAENLSDGVIAPLFWFLLLGLPGIVCYKLINTADSMIGYRTKKYEEFGWGAAKIDDLANYVPARLTALLIAAAAWRLDVLRIAQRDAPLHRSPNAGWPEGAMAGALDIALSGPRSYHGQLRDLPWVNGDARRELDAKDILGACRILWKVWFICFTGVCIWALF
jgi:adenosylcobinamide-phosphate synthase